MRHSATITKTPRGRRAAWLSALLPVLAAGVLAVAAAPALASAPSAQDQYLEVVPNAGGNQSPRQFSKSLGGDGGPVTKQQIVRLAERNAARRRGAGRSGSGGAGGQATSQNTDVPDATTAVATAASKGALSSGFLLVLAPALMLIAAAGAWRRRSRFG